MTCIVRIERNPLDRRQPRRQRHVRRRHRCRFRCLRRGSSRSANRHGAAIRQPPRARPALDQQVRRIGLPLFRVHGGELVEDPVRVGVQPEEPTRDIPLVGGDDGVLRHVLDLVALRVRVRDGGVEGVFVGPLGAGRERLVGEEDADEVERVGGFVDVHVDVGEGDAEEDEVAAVVVRVPARGW